MSPQANHPRLVRMIETASRNVESIFNMVGFVAAMWHWHTADGDQFVTLSPPGLNKDEAVATVREALIAHEAVAVLFIDEAWTFLAKSEAEAVEWAIAERKPDDKRAHEIVHFVAEDDTGELIGVREIIRPPNGKPHLGQLVLEEMQSPVGRFVGMLPRPRRATLQ